MSCRHRPLLAQLLVGWLALSACADVASDPQSSEQPVAAAEPEDHPAAPSRSPTPEPSPAPDPDPGQATPQRPDWLGTRVLPLRPDGYGQAQLTPAELVDRRLPPPSPATPAPAEFSATSSEVPDDVAARSTWTPDCPVGLEELRYLTVTFWGFDDRAHTGELLVHTSAADDLVSVFTRLFDARFPIEEMRVVEPAELDAPPTGDGNNTTAFVCRPTRGSTSWSEHAYGLAVDINPFHNPYVRGDLVLPELAGAYVDRAHQRPGMVQPGGPVTEAFAAIGWQWGGDWSNVKDWMHFSASGR